MNTTPEMNAKIVGLLRIDSSATVDLYAAERIEELEMENNELRALLKSVHDHYEETYKNWPHPDAPGHTHDVRGRWDKDGSPCEWCATWQKVREILKE